MLSIDWVKLADYYTSQARVDYYVSGGSPPGRWRGTGADRIGLFGNVDRAEFAGLFRGIDPAGNALIQNAGSDKHQAAWDLCFSDPKSVSLFIMAVDAETRAHVLRLREKALQFVLDQIEEQVAFTRRGKQGKQLERVQLLIGDFLHFTSRDLDPQVHNHCVVLNIGVREDGTTGTILSKPLYDYKMTAGALYRAQLAYLLQRELGLEIRRKGTEFEIVGISAALVAEASKRRQEIKRKLNSHGSHSSRAASVAAKLTRRNKMDVPFEELLARWQAEGNRHGFTQKAALELIGRVALEHAGDSLSRIIEQTVKDIGESESHFLGRELLAKVAVAVQGAGISAFQAVEGVKEFLATSPEIVELCQEPHDVRYTTREILERERTMLEQVRQLHGVETVPLDDNRVQRRLDRAFPDAEGLSEDDRLRNAEQRKAAEYLLTAPGKIHVVQGKAGTGKTFLLDVCRQAWEEAGYRVVGLSLAGVAARNLQEQAGIVSETLAMRLKQLDDAEHGRKQPRTRRGSSGVSPFRLDERTIICVDEAGMIGTRDMAKLIAAAQKYGAHLKLIGEDRQLPSIDAGPPLRAVGKLVGECRLGHITRQRIESHDPVPTWHRDMVDLFREGNAAEALELLRERGRLTVAENREKAIEGIVADWSVEGARNIKEALILAPTHAQVRTINQLCQEIRLKQLYPLRHQNLPGVAVGENVLHVGDWVRFTEKSRRYDLDNGQRGVVVALSLDCSMLTVEKSDGKRVTIPLAEYDALELGYAQTIHSAQGATVEHVYALVGGSMVCLELTYVEASRAKVSTRFYTDELEVGEDLVALARDMSREQAKCLAIEYLDEDSPPEISPPLEPALLRLRHAHSRS